MCPCGYLTAWHTLRLWERRSRREVKIITGKNERSQRKYVDFQVSLSVFWEHKGFRSHDLSPYARKRNLQQAIEVFSLVTPFVMMWCDMCSSFQFYGIFSLLDRHYSSLWQLKPADACNCDFSRFSWSGCKKRILILCENYLAGIYFNIT